MSTQFATIELTPKQFTAISQMIYRICGINLQEGKEGLVRTRLAKRVQALGLTSYSDYLAHLESDASGEELSIMVDSLTTNKTSFFREDRHFDFLRQEVIPELFASRRTVRIWSAGCSSGEEPYTLSIVLHEAVPDLAQRDVRILATDISSRILQKAAAAVYDASLLEDVPRPLRQRYFASDPREPGRFRVADAVRAPIRFARLNLMSDWPMRGPFDVIFCRNVMIYFDAPTQERLVQRFWELLPPGGHLLVGHSESLTSLNHEFEYVQPAVYRRKGAGR